MSKFVAFAFAIACCFVVTNVAPANDILPVPQGKAIYINTAELPRSITMEVGDTVSFATSSKTPNSVQVHLKQGRDVLKEALATLPAARVSQPIYTLAVYYALKPGWALIEVKQNSKVTLIPVTVTKAQVKSGIFGQVDSYPINTVASNDQRKSNPAGGAIVIVTDSKGSEVARTTADKHGHFRLQLNPGKYRVIAHGATLADAGRPAPMTVTVGLRQWVKVDLWIGSGTR